MRDLLFRRGAMAALSIFVMLHCVPTLYCQQGVFAVRGGAGTDVNLGVGFGGGAAYIWNSYGGGMAFEFGADFYYSHTTDSYTDQRGSVTVKGEDKTTLTVFGVRANTLFGYNPRKLKVYFIAGVGFVVAGLRWEETENAPNWNAPYHEEASGTSVGNIVNLGIGVPLATNCDLRLETPLLFFYSTTGKSTAFVPTATIGLTFRFN